MLGEISVNVFLFHCVTILAFVVSQMNCRKWVRKWKRLKCAIYRCCPKTF